eukprot:scaffold165993_cov20-Tisochrysis_lutea.AAC.1
MQVCLAALAAPAWEVRNGATQCLTALIVRVLGIKNTSKWENSKKFVAASLLLFCTRTEHDQCDLPSKYDLKDDSHAMSHGAPLSRLPHWSEFFQRFPRLHSFLLSELTTAVEVLEADSNTNA